MRARYYSVELMRFINEDIVLGDIGNSSSLNRYTYVEGNPATMVDPFGLCAKKVMNLFDAGLDAVKGRLHKIISLGDIKEYLDAEQLRKLASFVQSVSDAMDMLSQALKDTAKKDATLAFDAAIATVTFVVTNAAVLAVTGAGEIIAVGDVVIGGGIALSLEAISIFNLASSFSLNLMSNNLKDLSDSLNKSADNKTSLNSAKGLVGHDFEDYLTNNIGGNGSFSVDGRDFDGGIGNRWWEAKSGQYWDMLENNPNKLAKFKSDMGDRLRIATQNNATYEIFSNTPIPDSIKTWLTKKGIPFTEILD